MKDFSFLRNLFSRERLEDVLDSFLDADELTAEVKRNSKINIVILSVKDKIDSFFYNLKLCEHDYQKINGDFLKCSKCGKVAKHSDSLSLFIKKMLKRKDGIRNIFRKVKTKLCKHDYKVINKSKDNITEVLECNKCGNMILRKDYK